MQTAADLIRLVNLTDDASIRRFLVGLLQLSLALYAGIEPLILLIGF